MHTLSTSIDKVLINLATVNAYRSFTNKCDIFIVLVFRAGARNHFRPPSLGSSQVKVKVAHVAKYQTKEIDTQTHFYVRIMVHACWINGCTNRSDREPKRSWHSIPTVRNTHGEQTQEQSEERRRKWLENIGRKETPSKHSRVCSDHFVTGKKIVNMYFLLKQIIIICSVCLP